MDAPSVLELTHLLTWSFPFFFLLSFFLIPGTGPACKLAAELSLGGRPPAAVVLHSPFCSLTLAAKDLLCDCVSCCILDRLSFSLSLSLSLFHFFPLFFPFPPLLTIAISFSFTHTCMNSSFIFLLRFVNWEHVCYDISSPLLLLHADNDKIIDYQHSKSMFELRCKNGLPCKLFTQTSTASFAKTHNTYDYYPDVVLPVQFFLRELSSGLVGARSFKLPLRHLLDLVKNPNFKDTVILSDMNVISAIKWGSCLCSCCFEVAVASIATCCFKFMHSSRTFMYPGKPKQPGLSVWQRLRSTWSLLNGFEYVPSFSPDHEVVSNPIHGTVSMAHAEAVDGLTH